MGKIPPGEQNSSTRPSINWKSMLPFVVYREKKKLSAGGRNPQDAKLHQ